MRQRLELRRPPDEVVCPCGAVVETYLETDFEGSTFEYVSIHHSNDAEHSLPGSGVCTESDGLAHGLHAPKKEET